MAEPRYEIREAEDKQWYFVLIASNGEIVMTSETYTTKADAERGIGDAHTAATKAITP